MSSTAKQETERAMLDKHGPRAAGPLQRSYGADAMFHHGQHTCIVFVVSCVHVGRLQHVLNVALDQLVNAVG